MFYEHKDKLRANLCTTTGSREMQKLARRDGDTRRAGTFNCGGTAS
jgi:hypothetical protein